MLVWTLLLGVLWARRRLGVASPGECLPLGLALAHLGLLMVSNLSWPALPMALVMLTAFTLVKPASPTAGPPLPRSMLALAGLAMLLAAVIQARFVDDDYWIHAPTQALLARGDFPPQHFFFAGVPLKGHYGRDLLIADYCRLTGWTPFTSQFVLTTLLQPVTLLLLYWAFHHLHGRQAGWATVMVAAGIHVAGVCGLLAAVQNNNAPVHAWWALVLYAFARTWNERSWGWATLLGLGLGSFALIYETHFALSSLACLITLAWGLTWLPQRTILLKLGLYTMALACLLAFTQGGPITELLKRRAGQPSDLGLASQTQQVTLTFPKARLGQLRCRREANQWVERWSEGVEVHYFARMTDPSQGYAPFWDRAILGLHGLPLWLSPVVLVWAMRRRQVLAVWLLTFAAAAFFTPALIDFGPIFESEYLRWQFAAGLGCAGALGLALPTRWWPLALLYLATGRLRLDGPGPLVYRGAHHWITHQRLLDFSEDDWQAAQWLRQHSKWGETVLTHPLARPHQVSFESTLCGLTALRASRRLPLPDDEVGLVPSRQRPDVACFLASGDPDFLALTPADWVLWRQPVALVSRVQKAPAPGPLTSAPPLDLPIEGLPAWAEQGKIYPLKVIRPPAGRLVLGDGPDRIPCGRQPLWQAPYQAGRHSLAAYWWDSQGLHPLKQHYEVRVDTLGQMARLQPEIQAIEIQPGGKLDGWGVLTARVRVPFQDHRDWIGGARFLNNTPELEPLTIEKKASDVWQWRCRVLLPPAPGRHVVDLWLSPFHGAILRLRGPDLEITPNFYPASR